MAAYNLETIKISLLYAVMHHSFLFSNSRWLESIQHPQRTQKSMCCSSRALRTCVGIVERIQRKNSLPIIYIYIYSIYPVVVVPCYSSNVLPSVGAVYRVVRTAGLGGLREASTKKTGQHIDVWDQHQLDITVFALLHNLGGASGGNTETLLLADDGLEEVTEADHDGEHGEDSSKPDPTTLSRQFLRELAGRANFINTKSVVQSVFRFLEVNKCWVDTNFPCKCLKIILDAIEPRLAHTVVSETVGLLDHAVGYDPNIRVGISKALQFVTTDTARYNGSLRHDCSGAGSDLRDTKLLVSPLGSPTAISIFEVVHVLLRRMQSSAEATSFDLPATATEKAEEAVFQQVAIDACSECVQYLSEPQKVDVLCLVARLVDSAGTLESRLLLLRVMLDVARGHTSASLPTTLVPAVFEILLELSAHSTGAVRTMAHKIIHTLMQNEDDLDDAPRVHDESQSFLLLWGSRMVWHFHECAMQVGLGASAGRAIAEGLEPLCKTVKVILSKFGGQVSILLLRFVVGLQSIPSADDRCHPVFAAFVAVVLKQLALASECEPLQNILDERVGSDSNLVALSGFVSGDPNFFDEVIVVRYGDATVSSQHDSTPLFPMSEVAPLIVKALRMAPGTVDAFMIPYVHSSSTPKRVASFDAPAVHATQEQRFGGHSAGEHANQEYNYATMKQTLEDYSRSHQEKQPPGQVFGNALVQLLGKRIRDPARLFDGLLATSDIKATKTPLTNNPTTLFGYIP